MDIITFDTSKREELVDITRQVRDSVGRSGVQDGVCHLWCQHTTAGLTVNENADPDVKRDILMALSKMISDAWPYSHAEGNSPAHVKSSLMGCSLCVPVSEGALVLGTWQGLLFAEFDGPRRDRRVAVAVIPSR